MQGSRVAIYLYLMPVWFERGITQEEFVLKLALLVAILIVIVLGGAVAVIWLAGRTDRLRERFFPLLSCDQDAFEVTSEVLESLSSESRRHDFIALRVQRGSWHGKEWTFVWGTVGAMAPGERGPEWGCCECVFVLAPRSEEESLRKHAGISPFLFCGKDQCILRFKESKLRDVTFSNPDRLSLRVGIFAALQIWLVSIEAN